MTLSDINSTAREFISAMLQPSTINRHPSTLFAFYGSMGAGKTTFIKALCEELGVTDTVTSPTFAIINEYESPTHGSIYHFDFYRIKRLEEVYDMGFEDYFYSGNICFIEWPELIEDILPQDTIKVTITQQPDGTRKIDY
ncbi:MAG: tRNA (adenosine(37)-N6)-threonylcarbamoyltransferase complex ATPase subunit type 1 TsaE [Prevotellaceae bacterium]|nr:tRNA (adenosine(37)-N6)-threonylcarbamoyltransferase complex ATPase subunit type 1 TsaE [Prevotellaceae bacterium]